MVTRLEPLLLWSKVLTHRIYLVKSIRICYCEYNMYYSSWNYKKCNFKIFNHLSNFLLNKISSDTILTHHEKKTQVLFKFSLMVNEAGDISYRIYHLTIHNICKQKYHICSTQVSYCP